MRLLKVLCVAAIAIAVAAPSFAAVQNIKVSGSIDEKAIYLNNFDLRTKSEESANQRQPGNQQGAGAYAYDNGSGASINEDTDTFILSTIKVGVDSDLTDNISASIVLGNQTRWGDVASGVNVNKAYVTLKEFFYQPLTLKIGRQDIMIGQGFIVGPGIFRDPNGAFARPRTDAKGDQFNYGIGNIATNISGPMGLQYSMDTYYDAIRATLDMDPWTIDGIYAKIDETNTANDDQDLMGVNAAYKFDVYNAKAEGYYFFNRNQNFSSDLGYIDPVDLAAFNAGAINAINDTSVPGAGARIYEENFVHVIGLRGDIEPVESLSLSGEGAFEWGKLYDDQGPWNLSTTGSEFERKRQAWAVDLSGNYDWKDVSYKPNLGLGYVFLSGNKSSNSGKFTGWDPIFKGKFYSLIRDYQAGTGTAHNQQGGNIYDTLDYQAPSGSTNSHILYVDGGLKPMDDLSLKARYLHFWAAEKVNNRAGSSIGDEVDACLLYDYTEDVQFDLTGGVFLPGKLFDNNSNSLTKSNDIATTVTGSVKVAF